MKKRWILSIVLATTIYGNTVELSRDNDWNLMAVCQDMRASDIDMTDIIEIQNQDGLSLYSGEWAKYSSLSTLPAGYGVWVKGKAGVDFNTGESRGKIEKPLIRDNSFTLMASCQERDIATIDMHLFDEIQHQNGKTAYGINGEFASYSNLYKLLNGHGYWVKGSQGIGFVVKDNLTLPSKFTHQVINNRGELVSTTYEGYTIKLFANYAETPNSQSSHTGVVVRVDGYDAPIMHIQDSYKGKELVVTIYNSDNKLVGITDNIVVNTEGVGTIMDISVTDDGGDHPPQGCNSVTDTYSSFILAKDNALNELSKPFNGFQVKVTTSATIDATSSSTMAIYGLIDSENTGALLKLNSNYPSGTPFVVKVYKDGKLVGISEEKTSSGSAINFGSISTQECSE